MDDPRDYEAEIESDAAREDAILTRWECDRDESGIEILSRDFYSQNTEDADPGQALSASTGSPPIILHLESGTVEFRNNTIVEMGRRGNKADMLRFEMIKRDAKTLVEQIMCRTGEKAHIVIL